MLLIPMGFKLIPATFISRLNRFMIIADIGGQINLVHLPNSGRLTGILYPGAELYLKRAENISCRKSSYSVFAASHSDNTTVIIDAQFSNYLVRNAIEQGLINGLAGYRIVRENTRPEGSNTRLDFLLMADSERLYLEVKCVTHVLGGVALFPDAPTLRGRRQLIDLSNLLRSGYRAGLIFSVQRSDAVSIRPNYEMDPDFASLLKAAVERGLKIFTLKSVFIPGRGVAIWPNEPPFTF